MQLKVTEFAIISKLIRLLKQVKGFKFPDYCKVMKIFLEVKMFKKLFCGLSSVNFNIGSLLCCNVFLKCIETVSHLE